MKKNILIVVALVLLAGIGFVANTVPKDAKEEITIIPSKDVVQIANPASQACIAYGYEIDIRKDDTGGEVGYCLFPDGTECEEWSFFRNECGVEWKGGSVGSTPIEGGVFDDAKNEKYAGCPEWVNCMPGPDADPNRCFIPPQCEGYTQKAY